MIKEMRSLSAHIRYRWLRYRLRNRPYAEFYVEVMKLRTQKDPRLAVGGKWEEIGALQFEFMRRQGLRPEHRFLDIGCGSLRGGLRFIEYLDTGNYTGVDISPEILEAAKRHLSEAGLEHKQPMLRRVGDLRWEGFPEDSGFDMALAFSVLTHMPAEDIEECFAHLDRVMAPEGVFYATFFEADEPRANAERDTFWFPFEQMRALGEKHGWRVERVDDFEHPRKQRMLRIQRP